MMSSASHDHDDVATHHRHFKMYKPAKVLTQFKFTHRKRRNRTLLGDVIADGILPSSNSSTLNSGNVMAIGRLDEDSEGLLLLTTDGKVSERVRRKSVEKEYYVQVDGKITQEAIERLQCGVQISLPTNNQKQRHDDDDDDGDDDGSELALASSSTSASSKSTTTYTTLPCKTRLLDTSIIIVENKKIAAATKEEEDNQQASDPEQKKRKRRKKKFGGTCNLCKQIGHKARDCNENPMSNSNTSDANNNDNNNNDSTVQLALPTGIPPPPSHHNGHYNTRHTTSHPTSWISITINEGKNRQVRRMTAAVGYPTLRLVRVRIGSVGLDGMVAGEVRELSSDVIESIT